MRSRFTITVSPGAGHFRDEVGTDLEIALLLKFMVTDDELERVPFDGPLPTREIWLAQHRDTRKAPAVRLVAKRLTEAFERDARFSQA
nr:MULTISPECIES: hypothetical protein [unclassified Methylobacterium]